MLSASNTCQPVDPDGYGINSYLNFKYCWYRIPVKYINQWLEQDYQRRHTPVDLDCCTSEDKAYHSDIDIQGVDPFSREIAFGKWAVPKLKKELSSPDEMLVSKALATLVDLCYNPEKSVDIICQNVIARLGKLIDHSSSFIRQKVALLLLGITVAPFGANHIAQNQFLLGKMLQGVSDPVNGVRHEYLRVLYGLVSTGLVYPELIAAGYMDNLISRLSVEQHEPCLLHVIHSLEYLAHMSGQYRDIQIKANVIETVHDLLQTEPNKFTDQTKIGLLGILAQLMKHPEGKIRFSPGMLIMMTSIILNHPEKITSLDLLTNSIRILTFAIITTENKQLLLTTNLTGDLIGKLIDCSSNEDKFLQLSAVYLLTAISETTDGRSKMVKKRKKLEEIRDLNQDRDDVVRALDILLKVVQWTP